jgi:hypothetical protein
MAEEAMAAEDAKAAEQARAACETAEAWSDLVLAEPFRRFFELEDVERLDMDAVHLCDGYEYRYHRGGRFTYFTKHASAELPVRGEEVMPRHLWLHLPGCTCAACAPA